MNYTGSTNAVDFRELLPSDYNCKPPNSELVFNEMVVYQEFIDLNKY